MQNENPNSLISPWPHRWAVALACATFPLLWVGGLVTTTDAGMAVPDWPSTYGYNLFLYPWQSWLAGPWDLFVEHGHRLFAATVGMITIGLLVVLLRVEDRRWVRTLGFVALALVIFQGALGGMRVLLDERTLAMLHGMTGPVFFALTAALACFTSGTWRSGASGYIDDSRTEQDALRQSQWHQRGQQNSRIRLLATVVAVLVYLQLVLGAVLRHVPLDSQPGTFMLAVRFHLFLAGVLVLHIGLLAWCVFTGARHVSPLRRLASAIVGLVVFQLALGAATWVVKFSLPAWTSGWISRSKVAIQDGGWLQTHIITAHVATGSLLLAMSVALALYSHRLLARRAAVAPIEGARLGAAV